MGGMPARSSAETVMSYTTYFRPWVPPSKVSHYRVLSCTVFDIVGHCMILGESLKLYTHVDIAVNLVGEHPVKVAPRGGGGGDLRKL